MSKLTHKYLWGEEEKDRPRKEAFGFAYLFPFKPEYQAYSISSKAALNA